jgi:hypothetical protein
LEGDRKRGRPAFLARDYLGCQIQTHNGAGP